MHEGAIVGLSVGLSVFFLLVMAVVSRLFLYRRSKDNNQDIYSVDEDNRDPYQLTHKAGSWRQLFSPKQKDGKSKWVPTLSGIIKAGDEGLWSSALFTNPHGHPGEVSFEAICELFANELRKRSMTERSAYSDDISKFLNSAKRGATSPKRARSMSYKRKSTGRADAALPAQRMSIEVAVVERGLGRSLSTKRPALILVSVGNGLVDQNSTDTTQQRAWVRDGRTAEYHNGQMATRITPAELAALSLMLASPVLRAPSNIEANTTPNEKGAFSITIWSTPTQDGGNQISMRQHKRSILQLPSSGSGYSPLFAKHLACGALPFLQDTKSTNSILITDGVLESVKLGVPLTIHKHSQQTPQAKLLAILPSSREVILHTTEPSTNSSPSTLLIDAIAMLPFTGGLTPLASKPLIETVRFTASGSITPGRLLQRLEGLVDKAHKQSPCLNIFGPIYEPQNAGLLFRERERLGKVISGAITEELADKVARMQRYMTLLERLMALVPDVKPQYVLAAVQEATKKELHRSYADAVATHQGATASTAIVAALPTIIDKQFTSSDARIERHVSISSCPSAHRSQRSSLNSSMSAKSKLGRQSGIFAVHNLGKQVETLLKSDLPFSIDSIAMVARFVIVAWTLSVETVAWDDGEEGFRIPVVEELPETMILV